MSQKIAQIFTLYADGHIFARPQDIVYTDVTGVMVRVGSGLAGEEIDVGAKWKIATGLLGRVGYSLFIPTEDLYGTSTLAHFLEVELRYTY